MSSILKTRIIRIFINSFFFLIYTTVLLNCPEPIGQIRCRFCKKKKFRNAVVPASVGLSRISVLVEISTIKRTLQYSEELAVFEKNSTDLNKRDGITTSIRRKLSSNHGLNMSIAKMSRSSTDITITVIDRAKQFRVILILPVPQEKHKAFCKLS